MLSVPRFNPQNQKEERKGGWEEGRDGGREGGRKGGRRYWKSNHHKPRPICIFRDVASFFLLSLNQLRFHSGVSLRTILAKMWSKKYDLSANCKETMSVSTVLSLADTVLIARLSQRRKRGCFHLYPGICPCLSTDQLKWSGSGVLAILSTTAELTGGCGSYAVDFTLQSAFSLK